MLFFLPLLHNSISNLAKVGGKETSMREGRGWRIAGRDRIRKQECRSEEEEVYLSRGRYSVHVSNFFVCFPEIFRADMAKDQRPQGKTEGREGRG